jgi:translation initiation factor IF-3
MKRIEKKMKQSKQNREQIMIEEVQLKARASIGGNGDHLNKLRTVKKFEKELEEKQSKIYIKQMLERK